MNYRHVFHAGNFADVMKHVVLARMVEHLKAKPAAFRVVDLHAGPGFYALDGGPAERTGEWRGGIGRLYRDGTCAPDPLHGAAEALLAPWRKAVAAANDGARLRHYPGSPEIARRLLREHDALTLNELHPEDAEALEARFGRDARVTRMDAWTAAKALMPPPERRGLVLIDPPYEVADEARRAVSGLAAAHRRFATGIFALWYPIKAQADANALARRAADLGLPGTWRAELTVCRADRGDTLNGSGLILVNPPWTLPTDMAVLGPALAQRLADPDARFPGGWRMEELVGEDGARR